MVKIRIWTIGLLAVAVVCPAQVTSFTAYPLPTGLSQPIAITAGPDGNLWFAEHQRGRIGRITTAGAITEFPIPSGSPSDGIVAGPDGNLWFTERSVALIGRITTAGAITEFPISTTGSDSITAGLDGNLWFTTSNTDGIGRITTAGVFTQFSLHPGSDPIGITAGPDGNLWFTESTPSNAIGRITTAGAITEFPIPTGGSVPYEISGGPDGNLWFVERFGNNIGRVTPTGVITEFPVPTSGAGPQGITAGPDGNLWFAEFSDGSLNSPNKIGRITAAGVITEFFVTAGTGTPLGITTGPDGNLWITDGNNIVKATLLTTPPGTLTVYPATGGNTGNVTVQIFGSGFQSGATVKLTGAGPDNIGSNVNVVNSSDLTTTFSLSGAAIGARNVVVTNPDSTFATLLNGFTVEQGGAPQISVDIIGRSAIRIGTPQTYYLAISNSGSVDSGGGILSLIVPSALSSEQTDGSNLFVAGSTATIFSPVLTPSTRSIASTTSTASNVNLLFASAGVAAGATQFAPVQLFDVGISNFTVTAQWQQDQYPSNFDDYLAEHSIGYYSVVALQATLPPQCGPQLQTLTAAYDSASSAYSTFQDAWQNAILDLAAIPFSVGKAAVEGYAVEQAGLPFLGTVALAGLVSGIDACVSNYFGNPANQGCLLTVEPTLNAAGVAAVTFLSQNPILSAAERAAVGAFSTAATAALDQIKHIGDLNQAIGTEQSTFALFNSQLTLYIVAFNNFESCIGGTPPSPINTPGTMSLMVTGVSSLDPNDKTGTHGIGSQQYVSAAEPLLYSIYFDNQPTASAPAQAVTVTDTLDASLDPSTLTLGPITFPNQVVSPPSIPLWVSPFTTTVDLRPTTSLLVKVTASLNISTATFTERFQSLDPSTNLPPSNPLAGFLPPGAEGSVFFTVIPKSILTTGTVIQNNATIVFDVNSPINTPTWSNTIDNTKPVSQVSPLPSTEISYSFPVKWSGTDIGTGIQDFTVFVSDNGSTFTPALINATATQGIYTGVGGHTYGFYSIARDLVGDVENSKTLAETTTRVVVDTTPPVIVPQISGTLGNNGWYRSSVTVSWSVTDSESGIASSAGCNTSTFTADTAGVTLTCSATNGAGLSSSVPVTIKIDKTPPVISGMPAQSCTLWPPNGKLVQVATVTAADALSGLDPGSFKVTGASNEPSDSNKPQIVITPNGSGGFVVQLQADRLGTGTERVYTLTATAADLAGNPATVTATCSVPHDQGN